ncbi:kelch repeat protein [Colletotrichum chrysophilum]|uniref:Kelch repeat protein n=1 Tax=Colletotrichum chrysophilum TaxID=1836956 RepID=A0AAD9AGW5_9PEZI|nr:kelch repeat protein [Colletotrichum chrysophilum]
MRLSIILLLPWLAAAHGQIMSEPPELARRDDVPPISDFLRRAFASAIIIGDYLYIDGGEVAQNYDGKNLSSYCTPSWPVNSTLSINLKQSWNSANVMMLSAPKGETPRMELQGIWRDTEFKSFYIWGGQVPYWSKPPENDIWRFEVDGNGGGTWSKRSPPNLAELYKLDRATEGAFCQSKTTGYYFGGYANERTDLSITDKDKTRNVPGIVSYDLKTGSINHTTFQGSGKFTFKGGTMEYVPFGPDGLLLALGGFQGAPTETGYGNWTGVDFTSVNLYDIKAKKWHSQRTTGSKSSIPPPTEKFFTVGVQGPNKTYEIFIYGGLVIGESIRNATDDVYVLSLPSFVFFKANDPQSTRRLEQACVATGRQMISVGGTDGRAWPSSLTEKDPWPQGIGIFDMTEMRWSDQYNAKADAYESPEVVQNWYSQGNQVDWSSDEVEALFKEYPTNTPTSSPIVGGSGKSGKPTGAIVGGVVGGLAGLAVLAGLAAFLLKRKKRRPETPDPANYTPVSKFGSDGGAHTEPAMTQVHEASTNQQSIPVELQGNHGVSEAYSPTPVRHEMAA